METIAADQVIAAYLRAFIQQQQQPVPRLSSVVVIWTATTVDVLFVGKPVVSSTGIYMPCNEQVHGGRRLCETIAADVRIVAYSRAFY